VKISGSEFVWTWWRRGEFLRVLEIEPKSSSQITSFKESLVTISVCDESKFIRKYKIFQYFGIRFEV